METKKQQVGNMLLAQVPVQEICKILEVSSATVYRVKQQQEAGESLTRKPGSGGHNKKRTEDFLTGLACEIEATPQKSMRTFAKELNVSRQTISEAVRNLGAYSYVRRARQLLTEKVRDLRVVKGKRLLNWFKKNNGSIVLIFSDKKLWTVDRARNARNDRYLAYHVSEVPTHNVTKYPASAMMLGVVASDGKRMPPYWFPKGLRITAAVYLDVMETVVKPWIEANYPQGNYLWQQDSAPAHKAKVTQKWCEEHLARFWKWEMWPPSSPDLNPLDYGIWGYVEGKACATSHPSVANLKAAVEREWATMPDDYIVKTCKAFKPRLRAMLAVDGGHLEK